MNRNWNLIFGFLLIFPIILLIIISFFYTPYNPNEIFSDSILSKPSLRFLLGTDYLGRDILSRIMEGSKIAFFIGFCTIIISGSIGISIGLLSGYFGGKVDEILMRFIDILLSIPNIIMILLFIATFGTGLVQTIIAISFMDIAQFSKITRAKVLSIKNNNYVKWAKMIGVKDLRIIMFHIFPDVIPILLPVIALKFSGAIITESALSYLGLGVMPPYASFGNMLSQSQAYILVRPLYAIIPGLFITVCVIGFNLISDGINEKLKKK